MRSNASSSAARAASSFGRSTRFSTIAGRFESCELDRVVAALPVLERLPQPHLLDPGVVLADQIGQVALAGDERHQRDLPVHVGGLDQLHHLLRFVVQPRRVGGAARQPQDQLVQEQDQAVVAEAGRVPGHRRQAAVEVDEVAGGAVPALEVGLDQRGEQLGAHVGLGRGAAATNDAPVQRWPKLPQPASAARRRSSARRTRRRPAWPAAAPRCRTALVGEQPGQRRVGVVRTHVGQVAAEHRASSEVCPIMWKCSSSSRRCPTKPCLARSPCSSGIRHAASWPASSSDSIAMKCDLPEPKLPCRYAAWLRPSRSALPTRRQRRVEGLGQRAA
jgi:hypothetical protein